MSNAWFESWFDTDFYHILYQKRDDEEAQSFLQRIISFLDLKKDSKIIDIACGRGRHSVFLNECGFDVVGIDLAKHSIEYAKQFENERLHFFCHDKRDTFKSEHFDYALNLFTSFGYQEERDELLEELINMKQNLQDSGVLLLDYFNSVKVSKCNFESEEIERNNILFKTSKEIRGHQIIKNIEVVEGNNKHHYEEKVHLITKSEFESLFQDAGLEILHIFGDYNLNPYNSEDSDRLILIARKDL